MTEIIDSVIDEIVCEVESEFKHCNKCDRNKFKKEAPTLQKQLALISHIESHNLSFKQVVELQRAGNLYEVIGCDT